MDERRRRMQERQELQRKKREAAELAKREEEERRRLIRMEKAHKREAMMAAKMQELKRIRAEKLAEQKRLAAEKREAQRRKDQERKIAAAARKALKKAEAKAKRQSQQAQSAQRARSLNANKMSKDQADRLARMFHVNVRKAPKVTVTARHKDFLGRLSVLKRELEKAKRAATLVQQQQRKKSYPVTDMAVVDPVPQEYLRMGLLCKLYPLYDVSTSADVGSLLRVGHFIQKFAKMLHLTPFSFLDLQKALLHPNATALMTELHISLLLTVLRGYSDSNKEEDGASAEVGYPCAGHSALVRTDLRQRMVNIATWPEVLRIIFSSICEDDDGNEDSGSEDEWMLQQKLRLRAALSKNEWSAIPVSLKIYALSYLVSKCLETPKFAKYMQNQLENSDQVISDHKKWKTERLAAMREKAKQAREAAAAEKERLKALKEGDESTEEEEEEEEEEEGGASGVGEGANDASDADGEPAKKRKRKSQKGAADAEGGGGDADDEEEEGSNGEEESEEEEDSSEESSEEEEEDRWRDQQRVIREGSSEIRLTTSVLAAELSPVSDDSSEELEDKVPGWAAMSRTQKLDLNKERENRRAYRQTRRAEYEKRMTRRNAQLEAIEKLEAAIDAGNSVADLETAIATAQTMGLEHGTRRTLTRHPAIHEASVELEKLREKLREEQEEMLVEQELKQKLSAYFVRHEALGYDRHLNRYWYFNMEPDKVFVELSKTSQAQLAANSSSSASSSTAVKKKNASQSQWGFFPLSYLAKHLDELDVRGIREKALREELLRVARETGKTGGGGASAGGDADEEAGQAGNNSSSSSSSSSASPSAGGGAAVDGSAANTASSSSEHDAGIDIHVMEGNEHIGSRVRRLFPGAEAQDGTIVSWLPPGEDPEDEPLWHVVHDDGDEEDLDADELKVALAAYADKTNGAKVPAFLLYRNKAAQIPGRVLLPGVEDDKGILESVIDSADIGLASVCAFLRNLAAGAAPYLQQRQRPEWGPDGKALREWQRTVDAVDSTASAAKVVLQLEEGIHSVQTETDQLREDRWRTADEREATAPGNGVEFVGKRIRRFFEVDGEDEFFDGTIIKWRPAIEEGSSVRWLARMDDGDKVSLGRADVEESIDFFERQVEDLPDESGESPEGEPAQAAETTPSASSSSADVGGESESGSAASTAASAGKATTSARASRSKSAKSSEAGAKSAVDLAAAADLEASEALARQMAIDEKTWSKTGKFVGSQCRRFFMNKSGKGLPRVVDGKVVGVCVQTSGRRSRAAKRSTADDLFKVQLSDGTVEALTAWQVQRAVDDFAKGETDGWITQGHAFIGRLVARQFKGGEVVGTIMGVKAPTDEDPIMFHLLHEDGDGEDLEMEEVQQGFALHDEMMNKKGSKTGAAKTRGKRKAAESSEEEDEEEEEELTEEEEEEEEEDDDDEEEEEEEAEDDQSAPTSFLWPSLEARNRWQKVVEECTTTPALALAAMALRDHATAFGCCDAVEVTRSGRSSRKRAGSRSFSAARQQASEWSQEPESSSDDDGDDEDDDDDDE